VTTPVRTCVGCGARSPQGELIRFVAVASALALDERRRLPGRGAYLHPQPGCWAAFVRRRGTVRSLRAAPSQAAREALVGTLAASIEAG
jgi:predicted RNA-binding protein YlxR (DUF448 family)